MTAIHDDRELARQGVLASEASDAMRSTVAWRLQYVRVLLVLDVIGVVVAVALAQWLRFGNTLEPRAAEGSYFEVSAAIAVCWMLSLAINNSRSQRIIGGGAEEYRRVWVATLSVFGTVAIVSMLFKLELARGYLLIAMPVGLVLLLTMRWVARRALLKARRDHGRCMTRIVAVGSTAAVTELGKSLAREPWNGYQVVGACITGATAGSSLEIPGVGTIPVFGDESNIVGAATATESNAVAVTATERLHGRGMQNLSWELEKLDVELLVAPGVVDVAGPRLQMHPVAGLPLIHVDKPQYHGAKRLQKRVFDLAFASTVLVVGLPAFAAIALAIKISSKGPVFYRQERIGLDGRPFSMLKFRTMVEGADSMIGQLSHLNEADGGVLFKIRNDPRVTPVGRILRKYSLDEIPQFINVLKRDMSIVGPRPPLASEVRTYDAHTRRRLLVRPGITGLWQVSGRSDLSWEDSVRLDLLYVENWSMMADLLITVKTARAVLGHHGAY
jgi:exopolysaccharide biosynthesis polyprenyl glycosylphosphotransferase